MTDRLGGQLRLNSGPGGQGSTIGAVGYGWDLSIPFIQRINRNGTDAMLGSFDQSGPRWLGISDLIAEPEGPTFISYKVARSRLDRLRAPGGGKYYFRDLEIAARSF